MCVLSAAARSYIADSLNESLKALPLREHTIEQLLQLNVFDATAVNTVLDEHGYELHRAYWLFYQAKHVPAYLKQHVLPHIPDDARLTDIGCGSGTLFSLVKNSAKVGFDIQRYPQWHEQPGEFYQVTAAEGPAFLAQTNPEVVTALWSFHHMTFAEQEAYFKTFATLPGAGIILAEDSYSTVQRPWFGVAWHSRFHSLSPIDRQDATHFLDMFANEVLGGDRDMPMPGTYRQLEDWCELARDNGLVVRSAAYLGFPPNRDVYTPQSLLVFDVPK